MIHEIEMMSLVWVQHEIWKGGINVAW